MYRLIQFPLINQHPFIFLRDHDASVYLKLQGDALHVGGYEVNPCFWDEVEKKFAFGLFELDWDVFGVHIEGAVNRYTFNHAGASMNLIFSIKLLHYLDSYPVKTN